MNTDRHHITVSGISVEIVRKAIKNLHLGVYPPHGRVRVAAPLSVSDEAVRLAVIGKLGWIKRQREKFEGQSRQSRREMITGESHYYLGRRYRLNVIEREGKAHVKLRGKASMDLYVRPGTATHKREQVLNDWYRQQLRSLIPPLLEKWEPVLKVQVTEWGIKRMKTKWGTCNPAAQRIWVNLELAKKPSQCLEYILVHELMHLIERHHNDRFLALMNKHLPQWQLSRAELNNAPLGHEEWGY